MPPTPTQSQPQPRSFRANINIATQNMNGLTAPSNNMNFLEKWATINANLNQNKLAILALQETHLDQATVDRLRQIYKDKMEIIYSADPNSPRATAGVAFVINKSRLSLKEWSAHELIPGRALFLRIKWHESEYTSLLNIYAPTHIPSHPPFWEKIHSVHTEKHLQIPDFMIGDFNIIEDPIDRAPHHPDNLAATTALRNLRIAWNLQDAWRHLHPSTLAYTYRASSGGIQIHSRIDRFYVKVPLIPHTFDWEIKQSPIPTDHWMVKVKFAPKDAPFIGKGRWTWPLHTLTDDNLLNLISARGIQLQATLNDLKSNETDRSISNPQRLWEEFKGDIQRIAKKHSSKSYHKLSTRITLLEKDRKQLTERPDFDENNDLRYQEAFLASELEHLEKVRTRQSRDIFNARVIDHDENLGGIRSALSKTPKPRDLIYRLKVPDVFPLQYERDSKRMAELSRNYHYDLQYKDLTIFNDQDVHDQKLRKVTDAIPESQWLQDPQWTEMNWSATTDQIAKVIDLGKNKTATGPDGCPYELWKALKSRHERLSIQPNTQSFDIVKTLTEIITDIQTHDLDPDSNFATAWMCPVFKKKDPTDIANYRPISILNTDYKILTKVLALQLNDHTNTLIHRDQAGFIPRRSIFNHIRLAKAIINYAEITNENGAIIALDQEKAYDKIRHDYLWKVLQAFQFPHPFIKTIKALYEHAFTRVAINGVLSTPFQVHRGVRQGDPLSCALFNLAIEPLACMLRGDQSLNGLHIPSLNEKIIAKFFADDTSLYLSHSDRFDHVHQTLQDWCEVSGAKFNIEKTEIIPIGSPDFRNQVATSRKINPQDQSEFDNRIKIATDGEATRFLGAWIGNKTDDVTTWEPIIDIVKKEFSRWEKVHPTMSGRKLIVQSVVGGRTQFLAKAQGMPDRIIAAFTKIIRDFMWEKDSSPRIALDILQCPKAHGGLDLLDLDARNEAIEITWLKAYLNFSPTRPEWAIVTDAILAATADPATVSRARINPFLQTWNAPKKGPRAHKLNDDITRMLKVARDYNANLAAIRLSPELKSQLPAWYHLASDNRPITNAPSKCLLMKHNASTIGDFLRISTRIRSNNAIISHTPAINCLCNDCANNRTLGCRHPHRCAAEALERIYTTYPKMDPLRLGDPHDNLSLTKRRTATNILEREREGEILFDPTITCKDSLSDCFRIFTDPTRLTHIPAQRYYTPGIIARGRLITVYTDGACVNNGKLNARCGSGVYFGPNDPRNLAFRPSGNSQSNQAGEIIAILKAATAIPKFFPLKIISDSQYAINGLTKHLSTWEDNGWIGIKNAALFKATASFLKQRTATTSFQWTKGHAGNIGNEAADRLATEAVNKPTPDNLYLDIPIEFDLQGAKLSTISQATAYRGVKEKKPIRSRPSTNRNLHLIREALSAYHGQLETDETIWKGTSNRALRLQIRQFLYKATHNTQKIGSYWSHIPNCEERQTCNTCDVTETMEHILLHCRAGASDTIWPLARNLWPHARHLWPHLNFGTLLSCGAIHIPSIPPQRVNNQEDPPRPRQNYRGASRLLQILLSESAHLIWSLRCDRVIGGKTLTDAEIRNKWWQAINRRFHEDKIRATRVKRTKLSINLVKATWKPALTASGRLPNHRPVHLPVRF